LHGVSGGAARLIRAWGDLWGAATLPAQVTVEFSPGMRRAAGRALVDNGLVRLASWLRDAPRAIHDEILRHEVAHRPVRGWRCAVRVRAGWSGTLDIYRLERSTPRTGA